MTWLRLILFRSYLINDIFARIGDILLCLSYPSFSLRVTSRRAAGNVSVMSFSCLESQGRCRLTPFPIFSLLVLPSPLALSVFSCLSFFCVLMVHPPGFFQKILQHFSLRDRLFSMALVKQLGDDSWQAIRQCSLLLSGTGICHSFSFLIYAFL